MTYTYISFCFLLFFLLNNTIVLICSFAQSSPQYIKFQVTYSLDYDVWYLKWTPTAHRSTNELPQNAICATNLLRIVTLVSVGPKSLTYILIFLSPLLLLNTSSLVKILIRLLICFNPALKPNQN